MINTVFVIQKYVYKIIHCIRLINNQRLVYFIKYLRCYARSDWLIRLKNLCLQCTSKSINPAEVPALRAWTREPRTITITNCNKQSWFWLAEISIPFHSTCTLKFSRKNRTRSFPAYEALYFFHGKHLTLTPVTFVLNPIFRAFQSVDNEVSCAWLINLGCQKTGKKILSTYH